MNSSVASVSGPCEEVGDVTGAQQVMSRATRRQIAVPARSYARPLTLTHVLSHVRPRELSHTLALTDTRELPRGKTEEPCIRWWIVI